MIRTFFTGQRRRVKRENFWQWQYLTVLHVRLLKITKQFGIYLPDENLNQQLLSPLNNDKSYGLIFILVKV